MCITMIMTLGAKVRNLNFSTLTKYLMISTSPDRHTFQMERFLKRKSEEGKTPENDESVRAMKEIYQSEIEQDRANFVNPEWQKNNFEYDLRSTEWILIKVRTSDTYAQNLYASMCNNDFQKLDVIEVLKENTWSCSWRYAGGIVAHMREKGDYIDWYCSGSSGGLSFENDDPVYYKKKYVPEGRVTDEIRNDLQTLGWVLVSGGAWEQFD